MHRKEFFRHILGPRNAECLALENDCKEQMMLALKRVIKDQR